MSFALFVLRALIGGLFAGRGAQKLFGKFGGHGPEGTGGFFASVGIRPGKPMALAAGTTELGGGTLLALGLATPVAAAGLTSVMATATWAVHKDNGLWADKGGYEYPLVMAATLMTIVAAGPGKLSLDAVRGRQQWGAGWGLAALAAGVAGATGVIAAGRSGAPAPAGPEAHQAPAGGA